MTIICAKCGVHLGEITGRVRMSLARFICRKCLEELEAKKDWGTSAFDALFGR